MLTFLGRQSRYCDGISRRNFLHIGGLALGGIALPDLLRAEASSGVGRSEKAIIMIYLPGGPPHQDMWDIKTNAPSEMRGEFQPISTNVSGIQIGDQFPRMASMMDKFAIIRSMVGAKDRHASHQCMTGRLSDNVPPSGWPEMGAVLSKLKGPTHPSIPPYINMAARMKHTPYNSGYPGFLGQSHAAFQPHNEGKADMVLNGVTLDRLSDRRTLLDTMDAIRRRVDAVGLPQNTDGFTEQAFGVLTSGRLLEALDVEREDPKTRERYGKGTGKVQGDAAPRLNEQFLIARRLVEAGARCVTVSYSFWDWHGNNFKRGRENMPDLDQALTALVTDLHERGLDQDVSVVAWGEFGRSPRINKDAGRDHWPRVSCAALACGGMRTGQIIGSTNRLGEYAHERPVNFQEVFATLYHNLGIDINRATVADLNGRPRYLVDHDEFQPLPELC